MNEQLRRFFPACYSADKSLATQGQIWYIPQIFLCRRGDSLHGFLHHKGFIPFFIFIPFQQSSRMSISQSVLAGMSSMA